MIVIVDGGDYHVIKDDVYTVDVTEGLCDLLFEDLWGRRDIER